MQASYDGYMHGTFDPDHEEVEVMTVLLIGFDGRRLELTGTREVLWREFMVGDGGPCGKYAAPMGWEYWCPQDTVTTKIEGY